MKIVNSLKSYSDLNSRALIQILHRRVENSKLEEMVKIVLFNYWSLLIFLHIFLIVFWNFEMFLTASSKEFLCKRHKCIIFIVILNVIMLGVVTLRYAEFNLCWVLLHWGMLSLIYAECHDAECHYAQCHYAECHYDKCQYAYCYCTECRQVLFH